MLNSNRRFFIIRNLFPSSRCSGDFYEITFKIHVQRFSWILSKIDFHHFSHFLRLKNTLLLHRCSNVDMFMATWNQLWFNAKLCMRRVTKWNRKIPPKIIYLLKHGQFTNFLPCQLHIFNEFQISCAVNSCNVCLRRLFELLSPLNYDDPTLVSVQRQQWLEQKLRSLNGKRAVESQSKCKNTMDGRLYLIFNPPERDFV